MSIFADGTVDYDQHWAEGIDTYRSHPTSRHRRRFVIKTLAKCSITPATFVFDYGCGAGLVLSDAQRAFGLCNEQLGGCDISEVGIGRAREAIPSPHFYVGAFPEPGKPIDIAICTEVIEHTAEYEHMLRWIAEHLGPAGHLILTTPGVPMDPPDEFYGHVQHFEIDRLIATLEDCGFAIVTARLWGFPFFSLQKWVTKHQFDRIRKGFMHGGLDAGKRILFEIAYRLYFVHDWIPLGPQIFIHARKV